MVTCGYRPKPDAIPVPAAPHPIRAAHQEESTAQEANPTGDAASVMLETFSYRNYSRTQNRALNVL